MNSNYKLVYSEALNTWVAVAEHVSARGKKSALRLVTALALMAGGVVGTGASLAAPPLITAPAVNQLPTGAQVVSGSVSISQTQTATAASMAVQQTSNKAIVNWQSFNVGANAKVNITQPSSTSVLLNRVQSSDPSQIFGQIHANGQVLLLNPNGVYFAPGSRVDVGSFTASTHSLSDADFLNGKHQFNRNGASGSILNEGNISAGLGGYIALLAPEVRNLGVVVAQMGGTVALAAGESFELQFSNNKQLTNVLVTPATIQTLVDNGQAVQAPGGLIILSAQAASGLLGGVVKNSGAISATGLVNDGGTIRLSASHKIELAQTSSISADAAPGSSGNGGRIDIITDLGNGTGITQVDGTISAKGGEQGGDGGFVDTSAAKLAVGENTLVTTGASMGKAGTWLLDPFDITIAGPSGTASGTAYADSFIAGATSTILASTISNALNAGSNVTISTGTTASNTVGSITVNGPITWSTAKTLTLSANYNININAAITASAATGAGVVLEYNQGNSNGTYDFGLSASGFAGKITFGGTANSYSTKNYNTTTAYTLISNPLSKGSTGFNSAAATLTGNFALIDDYDNNSAAIGSTLYGSAGANGGITTWSATFDGLGHVIKNIAFGTSSSPSSNYNSIFATGFNGTFQNLGITSAQVYVNLSGNTQFGIFAGQANAGALFKNLYIGGATGVTVNGGRFVGSVVGCFCASGTAQNIYVDGLRLEKNIPNTGYGSDNTGGVFGITQGTAQAGDMRVRDIYLSNSTIKLTGYKSSNSYPASLGGITGLFNTSSALRDDPLTNCYKCTVSNSTVASTATYGVYVGGIVGIAATGINGATVSNSTVSLKANTTTYGSFPPSVGGISGASGKTASTVAYSTNNLFSGGTVISQNTANGNSYNMYTGSLYGGWTINLANCIDACVQSQLGNWSGNTFGNTSTLVSQTIGGVTYTSTSYTSTINGVYNGAQPSQNIYLYIVESQVGTYGTATPLNYWYSTSASNYGSGYIASILPSSLQGIQVFTAGATSVTPSATGVSGAITINQPLLSTLSAGSYTLSLTPSSLTYSGANFLTANSPTVQINKAVLNIATSKTYDRTTAFNNTNAYALSGTVYNGDATPTIASGSADSSGANAATYTSFSSSSLVLSNSNYTLTGGTVSATINKANATVTANSGLLDYNGANQTVSGFTATGLVGSETAAVLTGVSASRTAKNAGTYAVTPSGTDSNYNLSFVDGSMQIAKANATVTANSGLLTYNGANQTVSGFTATGLVGSETTAVLTGVSASRTAKNAGTYAVTPSGTDSNYNLSFVDGSMQIAKAALIATGNSAAVTYNGANQSVSGFTVSGLLGSDTAADLLTVSATGASGQNAGSYTNTLSTGTEANYTVSTVNGTQSIAKANATVTANSGLLTYNGANQTVSGFTATGLVGNETAAVLAGVSASRTAKNAGTYAVTPSGTDNNYNLSFVDGSMQIAKANATVTANSGLLTYNGGNQTVSGFTASGLVGSETAAVLTGVSASRTAKNAGTYAITPSGTDSNYNLSFVDGSMQIAKANATVTANSGLLTYNGANQTVSGFTATGLVGSETTAVLTGVSASRTAKNAGTYAVTPSGTDSNYNLSFVDGSMQIAKAPLVATGNSAAVTYTGTSQSVSGFTVAGLQGSDTAADLFNISATGASGQNAGSYTNTLSAGTEANYTVSTASGTLSIAKANATVTANSASVTYNGANQSVTGFTATGLVGGETAAVLVGVSASRTAKNAGTYAVTPSGTDSNYNLSFVDGSLVVAKANATVTANSASVTYNGANQSVSGFTATGLVGGETEAVLTGVSASRTAKNAGNYAVAASGTDGNYNLSFVNGSLDIAKSALTATGNSSTVTYNGANQSVSGFTVAGLQGSDTVADLSNVVASGATAKNAGSYANTVTAGTETNYTVSTLPGSLDIAKANATVTANNATKTYDGSAYTGGNGVAYNGFVNNETEAVLGGTLGYTGTSQGARNAGSYAITPAGLTSSNYAVNFADGTLTISPAGVSAIAVNLTGTTTKVYDGTRAATLAPGNFALTGFAAGEGASVSKTTGTFDNANAGTGKTVTTTLSSSDFAATGATLLSNYTLPTSASGAIGSITQAPLNATLTGTITKVYDGTRAATLAPGNFALTGFAAGEGASVSKTTGTFDNANANANAGTGKTVTTTLSSSDFAATGATLLSNYTLPTSASGAIGSITQAPLSVTANNATKTYDGSAYTGGNGVAYSGFVNNETEAVLGGTLGYTGTSQGARNAGSYAITPAGLTSSNYAVNFADGTLTISPAGVSAIAVNLTGTTTKVYDGTRAATLAPGNFALTGFAAGEGASVSKTTGTFDNANAGTGKTVTTTLSNSDFAATGTTVLSNYTLPASASGAIGSITQAPLNATLTGSITKVYDGTRAATLAPGNFALTGFAAGEGASVSKTSGTFDTASEGTGKTVTATLSSSDFAATGTTVLSNYTLPTSASGAIGTITPAPVAPEPVAPAPVTPAPVAPTPVTPTPVTPAPVTPAPVAPAPVAPAPVTPAPVTPAPVAPAPVTPAPVAPAPVAPAPVTPAPVTPAPVTPAPVTPAPVTPAPVTPAPVTPAPVPPVVVVIAPSVIPVSAQSVAPPLLTVSAASSATTALPAVSAGPSSAAVSSSSSSSSSTGVSVSTINSPSVQAPGLVAVLVPAGTATAGSGLVIALPEQVVTPAAAGGTVQVTLPNNQPLPGWIRYNAATQTLVVSAVPAGAFPLSVVVTVGGQSTVVQISESLSNS